MCLVLFVVVTIEYYGKVYIARSTGDMMGRIMIWVIAMRPYGCELLWFRICGRSSVCVCASGVAIGL